MDMIKFLLSIFVLIPIVVFGQLKIISIDNPSVSLNDAEIGVIGDPSDLHVYKDLRIVNTSDEPIVVRFQRKRLLASARLDQICDDLLCHDATDTELYITPIDITIAPGDSSIFKPQVVPDGNEFCAIHEYNIVNPFANRYTGLTIKFVAGEQNCSLTTKQFDINKISVYPNPTTDYFIVMLDDQSSTLEMKLTDALGKEVLQQRINSSSNKVSLQGLNNGVYFVQLNAPNGELIGVKRLIVKR